MTREAHTAVARARDEFLAIVEAIRPELHRYCARLTGSVIDGEDIVQDTLARAFYALSLEPELPALRPWLFRIAHNAALDHLKRHAHRYTEPRADLSDVAGSVDERPDPLAARLALARFLALPVIQRSAVILKDVLGHSLEDTAATMGTTVLAVKAALVRGRQRLREPVAATPAPATSRVSKAELERYAALFNARDWDGVRALVGEDCRLDLVGKSQRRGKAVRLYFDQYAKAPVELGVVVLDGQPALAARAADAARPSYFILLSWDDGHVETIRDFRYVPYIAAEATGTTQLTCRVQAPRPRVYRAFLDARDVATWMVPTGMTSTVNEFDPREGGAFRVTLSYDAPTGTGKTTAHADTYHGRFVELVPDERIVQTTEFETEDPALQGEMTITITLRDVDGGTEIDAVHDRLPPGLSPADNETGWRSSLAKLAALVEAA